MSEANADNIRPLGEQDQNLLTKGDRVMLRFALIIALGVLVLVAVVPRYFATPTRDYGPVVSSRQILITPSEERGVFSISDAQTGAVIREYTAKDNDFLKGQLPIFEYRRSQHKGDFSQPFVLTAYESGALVWYDPVSEERLNLHRKGGIPERVFGSLLN